MYSRNPDPRDNRYQGQPQQGYQGHQQPQQPPYDQRGGRGGPQQGGPPYNSYDNNSRDYDRRPYDDRYGGGPGGGGGGYPPQQPPPSRYDAQPPIDRGRPMQQSSRWDAQPALPSERSSGGGGYNMPQSGGPPQGRYDDRRMDPIGGGNGGYQQPPPPPPPQEMAPEPRQRRSRWAAETENSNPPILPGLATAIPNANVNPQALENYAMQVRIQEINNKLNSRNFIPPDGARSPSPPPQYDQHGRRLNTREQRYRQKLEKERISLIERALATDPSYRPPADFQMARRNNRPTEKVYIPIKEFPEIKFFGLIVGPRGNSLKKMEKESGAKIAIRGKGSVKEGKQRPGQYNADDEDDMHCLVTADTQDKVNKCVQLINEVIATAASTPEHQNTMKREQLRELAAYNGTFRDDENQSCTNCGNPGHRRYECPANIAPNAGVICHECGNAGHLARDCLKQGQSAGAPTAAAGFDSEYAALMAELNGGTVPASSGAIANAPQGQSNVPLDANGKKIPPWRDPTVWAPPPQQQQTQQQGYFNANQGMFAGVFAQASY